MIRIVQSTSAAQAKSYFSESLSKSDYFINDQEMEGVIYGKVGDRLGINGPATKEVFFALCENKSPETGLPLTPRTKKERTVAYDIGFQVPKSVSVLHGLSEDDHILKAFEKSVQDTMLDIQANATTRVRKGNTCEDRKTGELVWASFTHLTARPTENEIPDPHLHCHAYAFNITYDDAEKRFKAAKFRDIKADAPYYQARFHKRLSDNLIALGYEIRLTDNSFEIAGVPQKVIDLFSKRTREIKKVAADKGITDAKEMDGLGARTRAKKQAGLSMAELRAGWRKQIHGLGDAVGKEEKERAVRFGKRNDIQRERGHADACVKNAVKHSFERASVVKEKRLLGTAYRNAMGNQDISTEDIDKAFLKTDNLIRVTQGNYQVCTTKEVLAEEQMMVKIAQDGKGAMKPLYKDVPYLDLKEEQATAATHILTTSNRVSIVRGAAGTGKTKMMETTVGMIEKAGKRVTVVAPTAQASRGVLRKEGFKDADTVSRLLIDKEMQEGLRGQVLWVDEAGLLGTKDMLGILELAKRQDAKLVLAGDSRQHSSVVRGDSLRILNTVGGIRAAEVTKIYRQLDERYKAAVEDLSKGNVPAGFSKLDSMGAIKNCSPGELNDELVENYMQALKNGKSALVISPTHKQGDQVTSAIRGKLKQAKKIGKRDMKISKLSNINLTEAEKENWRNFQEGQVIQFNQNVKGIKKGSVWTVKLMDENRTVIVGENGAISSLPHNKAAFFDVFKKTEMDISKGDRVYITRNGTDKKENRLNNGQELEVTSVHKQKGVIRLKNEKSKVQYEIGKDHGHISHAYCITSHASQGKTVDEVFIAQPAATFGATNAKQFYVSVSRGRERVSIYTDDKALLMKNASDLDERQSALELVQKGQRHEDYAQNQARNEHTPKERPKPNVKEKSPVISKARDYGPEI